MVVLVAIMPMPAFWEHLAKQPLLKGNSFLFVCVFIFILCVFVSLCVSVFVCNLGQHDHPAGRSDGVRDGGDWRNQCYQTS